MSNTIIGQTSPDSLGSAGAVVEVNTDSQFPVTITDCDTESVALNVQQAEELHLLLPVAIGVAKGETVIPVTTPPGIPENTLNSLKLYVEHHRIPGGFLQAVLENNLCSSVARADPENLKALPDIVRWLTYEAPMESWQSKAAVTAWVAQS